MILHVTYETNKGNIERTFRHKYKHVLLEAARKHPLYFNCHAVTYDFEEVDEYGDKCGEC